MFSSWRNFELEDDIFRLQSNFVEAQSLLRPFDVRVFRAAVASDDRVPTRLLEEARQRRLYGTFSSFTLNVLPNTWLVVAVVVAAVAAAAGVPADAALCSRRTLHDTIDWTPDIAGVVAAA